MDKKVIRKLAGKILKGIKNESKRFNDITMRGGNPFEYGMRTDKQVIEDVLMRHFAKEEKPEPRPLLSRNMSCRVEW